MSVATADIRAMSDEQLREAWAADEASPALAEAARRDRADKTTARLRQAQRAIQDEWYEAAYEQYLAASRACRGSLLSREGVAHGPSDEFGLWSHRTADAMRWASDELREFWETWPRVSLQAYTRQRAAAIRAAKADKTAITEEAGHGDRVDADRRPEVDGDDARGLRRERRAGAVRRAGDTRVTETGTDSRERTGPVQPARRVRVEGETVGIVREGIHVAERAAVAAARAGNTSERLDRMEAARLAGGRGTVVCSQAPVKPPAEPIDGAWLANLADMWIGKHCYLTDSARHAIALWVMAQHFRTPDERRVMVHDKFPHLLFIAETPGSGKTTAMKIAGFMCAPYYFGIANNPTAPGLCMTIGQEKSVVCIDEAHRIIGPKGTRKADVVTIMCASFEQDGTYLNGRGGKANRIPVYAPMMIAAKKDPFLTSAGEEIGDVVERSHLILMSKPPEGTELAPVTSETKDQGKLIGEKMAQWAAQQMADKTKFSEAADNARAVAAEIGLKGRDADVWLAQFTVAALCSPGHLQAACDAALELRRNQPAPKEEDQTDPLADLEADLTGGGEIAGWG